MFENRTANIADTAQQLSIPVKSIYRIQPRDILQIRNLQNISYIVDVAPTGSSSGISTSGQSFEVDEEGMVALPVIGHVPVAGLTRPEATRKIEELYKKQLLKDPIIDIKVTNLKVTLFGEVGSQGSIPLIKDNTTLVELIGQAGGLTPNANEKNVKIIRVNGNKKNVIEVDLGDINSITDPRTLLQNGDIIYVAQNQRAIRTEKFQNLSTYVQPALLLINTALLIITLSR